MALLDIAENKIEIIETIFHKTYPGGWSGSLAEILEVRSKAFAQLLNHPLSEVREYAQSKLILIEKNIQENRAREAEEGKSSKPASVFFSSSLAQVYLKKGYMPFSIKNFFDSSNVAAFESNFDAVGMRRRLG